MKIGVDLRALQIGHQYRGIGEVVKRTLDEMFKLAIQDGNSFVFYVYDNLNDPVELLHVPEGLRYEAISAGKSPLEAKRSKYQKLADALQVLYGNPIKVAKGCDVFLQYDYALGVPTNVKTILIKHDIIPFIFWNQFFESPMVPFKNKAARTTLRTMFHNYRSTRVLRKSLGAAYRIVTVSDSTRQDLHTRFGVPLRKMQTIHLGVATTQAKTGREVSKATMPTKPFLLFVGGVDKRRRRVDDIVSAFNNIKADGHDIQLVLVGENFQSFQSIPEGPVRYEVLASSYKDDILTMGYVDDATKQYLFQNALAFVFPSMYEGFGIPILEAMVQGCPVITYKNSAIPEVGGEFALYATGWQGIERQVRKVLDLDNDQRQKIIAAAKQYAESFTWQKTARGIYEVVSGVGKKKNLS